ncbi:polysaccharide deacetylase family protein [Kordiimonas sp.]|uniref:polysaccharide deacetylase family protein n=1 Tax=Kordiimonas sp. TaxID=1970157 RepID=UPI003A8D29F8
MHLDILSSAFFMLSDFDAFHSENRDCHGRFSAKSSRAYAGGFLDRPLLDEYVEILWLCMKRLWPSLVRKQPRGEILVSCDVDRPFLPAAASVMGTVKSLGADVLRRRSPGTAVRRLLASVARGRFGDRLDPYNTFDWYMSVCEQYGRRAAFYFLVAGTSDLDGDYSLEDDRIEALIRSASSRGHEVGIHGSYNSILDEKQIVHEKQLLENCLTRLGIDSVVAGNRQHYLRWNTKTTAGFLDDAGYIYDTTGGYADHTGFRFGTAREFPMWCWHKQERLHIIQRPLIVMDVTLLSQEYMALGYGNAVNEHVAAMKDRALRYGGNFTVLWHNSNLLTRRDRELFEYCIQDEKQITP